MSAAVPRHHLDFDPKDADCLRRLDDYFDGQRAEEQRLFGRILLRADCDGGEKCLQWNEGKEATEQEILALVLVN